MVMNRAPFGKKVALLYSRPKVKGQVKSWINWGFRYLNKYWFKIHFDVSLLGNQPLPANRSADKDPDNPTVDNATNLCTNDQLNRK